MSELRQNLATREWVIIASERARRPHEFAEPGRPLCDEGPTWEATCPFCPGNEERDLEIARFPGEGPWQVRIVGNRYPALRPAAPLEREFMGLMRRITGVGYHEVIVESPVHNTCAALESEESVARVFQAFVERAWAVQNDPRIEYVLFFKNHGRQAGASLRHPHAQMMALPMVPSEVRVRADAARAYFDETGRCAHCAMVEQELAAGQRVVLESKHFVVFVPYAAASPFHLWIVPRAHAASFLQSSPDEIADLGWVVRAVLRKLYKGLNNPDFNYVIRSAPVRDSGAPYLHWYLSIVPRISLAAGFEMGSGIYINPSLPEECARFLRTVDIDSLEGEAPHESA
ncbi:galactose-1-phosphate uridylyltransferase [Caldilinea sp.]|jgi:UDPglucose--hexose-1-phosphate uridylyltransferase|uniref:galactose-1-phosphate uridylyltransferase n=1 Tax=Caldilinea sp. TaxID=2293560 RepID=UPI0021DBD7DD|nr:galactose-1-phosphate uridylyltransferase [Caldilinea sp.]GIV69225.1 MAG: galactose-1-phosphate uridylyltransferase [Caldilinea sp.]